MGVGEVMGETEEIDYSVRGAGFDPDRWRGGSV